MLKALTLFLFLTITGTPPIPPASAPKSPAIITFPPHPATARPPHPSTAPPHPAVAFPAATSLLPHPAVAPPFRVLVIASRAKDHLKMIAAAHPFFDSLAAANNFGLDFSDDTSLINTPNLAHYQVFVMLHLAPFDMSQSQQLALQHFVEDGKGWVGIHAAGLTGKQFRGAGYPYWQWFENFMGGITYSPHPAFQNATLIVEDHNHPATRHLPAKMQVPDEWYEFNKSPRGHVRILASVDESTYHQNTPMGDHPIIWSNQHYRRMIYIGVGHDPVLLADTNYAALLRDAILWAGSNPLPSIPMKNGIVNYEQQYSLPISKADLIHHLRQQLPALHLTTTAPPTTPAPPATPAPPTTSAPPADSLTGTGQFKVITTKTGHYYWLRFDWVINIAEGAYTFRIFHYYEKPIEPGITNDWSKIEYRWWDNRLGHPWSAEDSTLFEGLHNSTTHLMNTLYSQLKRP